MDMENSKTKEENFLNKFTKPVEDLAGSVKDLGQMELDAVKLKVAQMLSASFSKLLSLALIILVAFIFLSILSAAFIFLLGEFIGSYAIAFFIVAGIVLFGLIILIARRNKMFRDGFVKMFVNIFFSDGSETV